MNTQGKNEAAARHRPIARSRNASNATRSTAAKDEVRHGSESRLQAAVVCRSTRDERDPYADVPCTD